MGKKNIRKLAKKKKQGKIPAKATELKQESTDNENPVFSFKHACSNNCLLSDWQKNELSQLMRTFKLMESLPWKEVRCHKGLNIKPVDNYVLALPSSVPPDKTIEEVKVNDEMRLFGFRGGRIFHIIWFDREHKVVPYHKSKRKRA